MSEERSPRIEPDRLFRACDISELDFASTEEIEPLQEAIGQALAMQAVEFGVEVDHPSYHIFALGLPGSGRSTMIRQLLETRATGEATPSDWCYVYNFDEPRAPNALEVPAGRGPDLRDDVDGLLRELERSLPEALQAEEFQREKEEIVERARETQRQLMQELQKLVEDDPRVSIVQTPGGFMVAPARGGEPIDESQLRNLPEEERTQIRERRREVEKEFAEVQRRVRSAQHEAQQHVSELQRRVARRIVDGAVRELRQRWEDAEEVAEHLERMADDIVEHAEMFVDSDDESGLASLLQQRSEEDFSQRYQVNVITCNEPDAGAPVVEEPNPTYHNLIGRIEHRVQFGTMMTDHRQIADGALHRANGGYLIVEASDLLQEPFAWRSLKRALRTRRIRLEELTEYTSLVATTSLKPEPIPLDAKVVVIGDPRTYHLLYLLDEEFRELFKVKADFSPHMERDRDAERKYAAFVASRCQEESLPAFDASAVARIIEFGSRLAQDQDRLTTQFGEIADLVRESAFWGRRNGNDPVRGDDVRQAIRQRERRVNRPERELLDLIEDDVLAVEPAGEQTGQLFGLAVLSVSDHTFARPIKVEASAFMGTSGVVDIEREVRLGGPLHNKGVLVLSGYLGDRFAQDHPLILSASLSFDQLYEEVEGDSASAAELYALLSAISGVPLRQGVAVTGAMNQKGEIQPIGAVSTKIEGFYRACERRGLNGDQGVMIPQRNLKNLVLADDVVGAVRDGMFHVWAIRQVEDGWPILTGRPAGRATADGEYPEDSIYGLASRRLREWAEGWRNFGRPQREGRQRIETGGPAAEADDREPPASNASPR